MGEDLKPIGTLYFKDNESGEYKPLTSVEEVPTLESDGEGTDDIKFHWCDDGKTGEITTVYLKWLVNNLYTDCLYTPDIYGRWLIAEKRREKRKARRFGGRWVERKLHRHKNGRDNLSYVWREWWKN